MSSPCHSKRCGQNTRHAETCSALADGMIEVETHCHHTEDHSINSKLLAMSTIVFEEEHVACAAKDEEQQEDGVDWDIGYDRRDLSQGL